MTFASRQHFSTALWEWRMDLFWLPHTEIGRQILEEDLDACWMPMEKQGHWHNVTWRVQVEIDAANDCDHVSLHHWHHCSLNAPFVNSVKFLCRSAFFLSVPQLSSKDLASSTCMNSNMKEWATNHYVRERSNNWFEGSSTDELANILLDRVLNRIRRPFCKDLDHRLGSSIGKFISLALCYRMMQVSWWI